MTSNNTMLSDATNRSNRKINKPALKKNVKYLSKAAVNQMTQDIRLKKQISRDIIKIRKEISRVDLEIKNFRTRHVPEIKYQISKRQIMCKKLQSQSNLLNDDIININDKVIGIENEKTSMENVLSTKHENEIKWKNEDFASKFDSIMRNYEFELKELENMQPKDELELEINKLRQHLVDFLEECDNLKVSNEKIVAEHKTQFEEELDSFKLKKNQELTKLIENQKSLINEKESFINSKNEIDGTLHNLSHEIQTEEEQLNHTQTEANGLQQKQVELNQMIVELNDSLQNKIKELGVIEKDAQNHDNKYNNQYNIMEHELAKRKKLENSIDELKGFVRCFAYANEAKFPNLTIDYAENLILDKEDELYTFNKIIPSNALSVPQLIFREYKPYHDMCIHDGLDFNLFTVSNKPWINFRYQFIEFLLHEYNEKYTITIQDVFLSDEKISKDLLSCNNNNAGSSEEKPSGSCINIKFDNNTLVLNTKILPLQNYDTKNNSINYDILNGIHLLKFQFFNKERRTEEVNDSMPTNFHLIHFESFELLYKLKDHMIQRKSADTSHVGHVINRLLYRLKSCFIFDFDSYMEDDNPEEKIMDVLNITTNIGQIPNPKKL